MSLEAFPQSFKSGLAAAIEAAAAGAKRDGGHAFLASGLSSPIIKLYKSGALVGTGTFSGALTSNTTTHKLATPAATITLTASIAPTDALTFEILKNDGTVGLRGAFPADAILSAPVVLDPPPSGGMTYTIDDLVDEIKIGNDANPGAMIDLASWGARLFAGYTFDGYPGGGTTIFPWYEFHPAHPSVSPWTVSAPNSMLEVANFRLYRLEGSSWVQKQQRNSSTGWWGNHFYQNNNYGVATRDVDPIARTNGIAQPANQMGFNGAKWIWHGFMDNGGASSGLTSEVWAVCLDAKLSLIDTGGTDDRANVKLLGHVAADWYGNSGIISEAFHARVKYVTSSWQRFGCVNMTITKTGTDSTSRSFPGAISEAALRANPPPFLTA